MPYGQQWRTHQRLQASYLNIRVPQTYCALQDIESKQYFMSCYLRMNSQIGSMATRLVSSLRLPMDVDLLLAESPKSRLSTR